MSLIAWYPLNGDTRNTVDQTTSVVIDSPTYVDGKIGQCLYTNSKQSSTVSFSKLENAKVFSVAAWVNLPNNNVIASTTYSYMLAFSCYNPDNETSGWFRYALTTGGSNWFGNGIFTSNSGTGNTNSEKSISARYMQRSGEWRHLVLTADGETFRIYLDGKLHLEQDYKTDYPNSYLTGEFFIGQNGANVYLNDIRIFNHCL